MLAQRLLSNLQTSKSVAQSTDQAATQADAVFHANAGHPGAPM
jgi:transketolase